MAQSRGLPPDLEWLRTKVDDLKELGIVVVTDVAEDANVAKETESQCEGSRPNSKTFSPPVVSAS
jgi:hypothetical protein